MKEDYNIIDPTDLSDVNQNKIKTEVFLLFCIAVAGKNAKVISKGINGLLSEKEYGTPFQKIRYFIENNMLYELLKKHGLGQYNKIIKAYKEIVYSDINLYNVSINDLESFHGIGKKTSRYFILYTQNRNDIAVLDTHILKFLKRKGYNVPSQTPSSEKKYKEIENIFLNESLKYDMNISELDLNIWLGNINE